MLYIWTLANSGPSVGLKVVIFNIISVKITIAIYFLKSSLKGGLSEPFEPPSLCLCIVSYYAMCEDIISVFPATYTGVNYL